MASTTSSDKGPGPVQAESVTGERRYAGSEPTPQRQGSIGSTQTVHHCASLQPGREAVHPFAGSSQQPMNTAYIPSPQTVWPPGAMPYLQPQVYMYPGLPGSPSAFFPAGALHPAQRSLPQLPLGMMVAGQHYPMNSVLPFNMTPAAAQEAWLQARNLRPQPGMVQGVRPTGWGGIPFQAPQQAQQNQRWQQTQRQEAANTASRRPDRMQGQPPPPPTRASSMPPTAQTHTDLAPAGVLPASIDSPSSGRASSLSYMEEHQLQQPQHSQPSRQHQPQQLAQQSHSAPAATAAMPSGKVPCAFFLKTGTCAYGDKCKFEHPWDQLPVVRFNTIGLPLRPGQPECAYYLRHARCGFGPSCKFHHPEPGTSAPSQESQPPPDGIVPEADSGAPPFTATGIPAGAAVTGIPVPTTVISSMPAVAQGVPVPEPVVHRNEPTTGPAPAQTENLSQEQDTSLPSTTQGQSGVPYVGLQMSAMMPTLPGTALQQPQAQLPTGSVFLPAAVPAPVQFSTAQNVPAAPEQAQPTQLAQQTQQASQPQEPQQSQESQQAQQPQAAQQAQQAQQQAASSGAQQQAAPLAAHVCLQSWPQPASLQPAAPAMYAQIGAMPVLPASSPVGTIQLPSQQVSPGQVLQPSPVASVQLPVQPTATVAAQPAEPAQAVMAYGPQVMYTSQPAQPGQYAVSTPMLQVPAGAVQPGVAPAAQYVQGIPLQQQLQQVPQQQQQQQQHVQVLAPQQVAVPQQVPVQVSLPQQVPVQVSLPPQMPVQTQLTTQSQSLGQPQVAVQQQVPLQQIYQQQAPLKQAQAQIQVPQAVRPSQHFVAPQAAVAPQTLVAANPALAAAQAVPLVVSPAYQAAAPPGVIQTTAMAAIPLRAPTIPPLPVLDPAASKDIGQPNLDELTAALPNLHLSSSKAPAGGKGALESAPSVSTPLPSEASLATASTTSTVSGGTLSSDAAKAIETVRHSLEDNNSAEQGSKGKTTTFDASAPAS